MKKIFRKSNIFAFVLGAIIFGGIVGVSAYTILANDIGYTPKDTTWEVDNVKDAIDDLYKVSKDYVKLDEETTVSSSNLLNGITAYDNNGNLITGAVSTDCVSGNFVWTQNDKDNGRIVSNFAPNYFTVYGYNPINKEFVFYYNRNVNSEKVFQLNITNSSNHLLDLGGAFSINNNFKIKFAASDWLNQKIYYMACK